MKSLVFSILSIIFAWLAIGFITKDFDMAAMALLIFGLIIGYQIGKKQRTAS